MSALTSRMVLAFAAASTAVTLSVPPVFGQCDPNYYWGGGSGSWFTPQNWGHEELDPNGNCVPGHDGVPGSGDFAVADSGSLYVDLPGAECFQLDLDANLAVAAVGDLSCTWLDVGRWGTGSLGQTGGAITLAQQLHVGWEPGASGSYTLDGGTLSAYGAVLGKLGDGGMWQNGGTVTLAAWLTVGGSYQGPPGGSASYSLEGGQLSADNITIAIGPDSNGTFTLGNDPNGGDPNLSATAVTVGGAGTGSFIQNGGTVTVNEYLTLGADPNSDGSYDLTGGTLSVGQWLNVGWEGDGSLAITDGGLSAYGVNIGPLGYAEMSQSGGTVTCTGSGMAVGGLLGGDPCGAGLYLLEGDGILSVGDDPEDPTDLNIANGPQSTGTFIQNGGSCNVSRYINLALAIGAAAEYHLQGGEVSAEGEQIGMNGTGTFVQTGGTNTITQSCLTLGCDPNSTGTYGLSGGDLEAPCEIVADAGTGVFTQTAGTNTIADYLTLANQAGSSGQYHLSATGSLSARSETIGQDGMATFTQTGGTNTIADSLMLGLNPGSDGTYGLSGSAVLNTSWTSVGNEGTGTFIQTGGTKTTQNLTIANLLGSSGTYELSGTGEIVADQEFVGHIGDGTLRQTGGTNTITAGGLDLGSEPGADGWYDLQGGSLTTSYVDHIGFSGQGTFTLSGGAYTAGEIILARFTAASRGEFTFSAGALSASDMTVGYQGQGTFTHTGGVSAITGDLNVGGDSDGGLEAIGNYHLSGSAELSAQSQTVGGAGTGTFTQTGGINTIAEDLRLGVFSGADGTYELSAGALSVGNHAWVGREGSGALLVSGPLATLDAWSLNVGGDSGPGRLDIADAAASVTVGELVFGPQATFDAAPGSVIQVTGRQFMNRSTDPNALAGLGNLHLICATDPYLTYLELEVAGRDGPNPEACANNFEIDTLTINGVVELRDNVDNGNRDGAYGWDEALYVNAPVENWSWGPSGILYTNGLHVYANCALVSGDHGGHVCYGTGCGDFDHDCDADLADFFDVVSCLTGPDVPIGLECNPADCDADGDVDLTDFAEFQVVFTE